MVTTSVQTRGIIFEGETIQPTRLTVRFTHDKNGNESISISDDENIMLQVDFKDVEDIIKHARKMN